MPLRVVPSTVAFGIGGLPDEGALFWPPSFSQGLALPEIAVVEQNDLTRRLARGGPKTLFLALVNTFPCCLRSGRIRPRHDLKEVAKKVLFGRLFFLREKFGAGVPLRSPVIDPWPGSSQVAKIKARLFQAFA